MFCRGTKHGMISVDWRSIPERRMISSEFLPAGIFCAADAKIIDGAVNGAGRAVRASAGEARKVQSGNVRNYAAAVGVGVVLLLVWFVIVRGIL